MWLSLSALLVACSSPAALDAEESSSAELGAACVGSAAPEACGNACNADADCGTGAYCNSGRCSADCSNDDASLVCGFGQTCGSDGRCAVGEVTLTTSGDGSCASVEVVTRRATPTVQLVIDRSASMLASFGADTRWNTLRNLVTDGNGPLAGLGSSMRLGLSLFTARSIDSGPDQGKPDGTCPQLTQVDADFDNLSAIETAYDAVEPLDDTPTGDTLRALTQQFSDNNPAPGEPIVYLLATDGEPDSCEDLDPADRSEAKAATEAATAEAYAQGIRTYVLFVGAPTAREHLNRVAYAGRGLATPAEGAEALYFVAEDSAALEDTLSSLLTGFASCEIELEGQLNVARACEGTVLLNGEPLGCGDANGWRAVDSRRIQLLGSACDTLNTPGSTIEADFPCAIFGLL